MSRPAYTAHPTAVVDDAASIGVGARIGPYCQVSQGAKLGPRCYLEQNVFIGEGVVIGRGVRLRNNVSMDSGTRLEDNVFCGPNCVFTTVVTPRVELLRYEGDRRSLVRRGATIGANAALVGGVTVGQYAVVSPGSLVVTDVADYAVVTGVPAQQTGWMSRHGHPLLQPDADGVYTCPESGWRYREVEPGVLRCLDWPEDDPLP